MIEKNISDIMEGHDKVDFYIAIIEALSKQVPYRPKPCGLTTSRCLCGATIKNKSTNYCGKCGQKLNWEE
jgi:hypothetical protein